MRVLAVSLASLACAFLPSCGPVDDYVTVHTTELEHELGGVRALVVRNRFGRIQLRPVKDGDTVTVKAQFKVPESQRERLAGIGTNDLSLGTRSLGSTVYGASGEDLVIECGQMDSPMASGVVAELEVTAPTTVPWYVWANAGAIEVEADGNKVSIDADLGSVTLKGSVGDLTVHSTVSPVTIDVAKLLGGSIDARGGDIDVNVRESGPHEDLTLLTLDGDATLGFPRDFTGEFQLRSSLADVVLENVPGLVVKDERKGHSAAGKVGTDGPKVRVIAETGDVRVTIAK
jgi:hypothetical protein